MQIGWHHTIYHAPSTITFRESKHDAIAAVRALAGPTNGRNAAPGTIRGSYCMSFQENIVHASDSPEAAAAELQRFFRPEEILEWKQTTFPWLYASDEW